MSRLHSSQLNLGGLQECTIPRRSASRSPARPKAVRPRKPKEAASGLIMDVTSIDEVDQPVSSPLNPTEIYVNGLRDVFIPRVIHNDRRYILMPAVSETTGQLINDLRRISYSVVEIVPPIYRCSCNSTLSTLLDSLDDRIREHIVQLSERECIHVRGIREGGYDMSGGLPYIDGGITLISDDLKLFITCPPNTQPGIVRVLRTRANCTVCHKDTCSHVKELNGTSHLDFQLDENEEAGDSEVVIKWRSVSSTECEHHQPVHRKKREATIADDRGFLLMKQLVTIETSSCCTYVVHPTSVFCLTETMLIHPNLLKFYESALAKAAMTLSGYWRTITDFGQEIGKQSDEIISLSTLSRAWNAYLTQLEIPSNKFGCVHCGQYPRALVFDGLQMGIRASVVNEKPVPNGNYTFLESPLPYLGKLQQRKQMLSYLNGETGATLPDVAWPAPILILLDEAIDEYDNVRMEYKEFLLMLFANSPLPLLLQAGSKGARRTLLDELIDGTLMWKDEELSIQREFPTLYRSLRPLIIDNSFPSCVIGALDYVRCESDFLLKEPPHNEAFYGLATESTLESFPLWPLQRGMTSYTKDKNREEQLDCSAKIVGESRKLSPGLMLVTCAHRRPYGFRVLQTPESVKDVFQVVLSRLGSNMPDIVIYDNSCRLAAYSLAREPARFANVRFLVDRFHHANHVSCALSLRIRSYDADPAMAALNSQSCEQTNALLRHLGNSLPFMSLPRYIKTITLSLSRN